MPSIIPHVQPGDLILVTGANGYIASMTITKLLAAGYLVRGTVRDVSAPKNAWMKPHYGPNFELVQVPDTAAPHAFDEAIKGVNGVSHIAASLIFLPDPNQVITPELNAMMGILEAAEREKSVKRVVYTSSQCACIQMEAGAVYHIDQSTWNEKSKDAWTLPITPDFPRSFLNYAAKKTETEQRAYKWVEEKKPHFVFNSVVPNVNWGTMVRADATGFISSAGLLKMLWDGQMAFTAMFPPQWYVDVEDNALLQFAALTEKDVESERLLAFGGRFSYNQVLAIFRKLCPDKKFVDDIDEVEDRGTVDTERSVEILQRLSKEGFSSLEETVKKWIPWVLKAEKEGWGAGGVSEAADDLRKFE